MVVVSSTIAVGPIGQTLSAEGEPVGEGGEALERAFPRLVDDLMWWVEAAKTQRQRKAPREARRGLTSPVNSASAGCVHLFQTLTRSLYHSTSTKPYH